MPRKNPLGKIKDAATETIKDPIGTASKAAGQAVQQARGGVEIGKAVAGQVLKTASGVVTSRAPGRKASTPGPIGGPAGGELRAVTDEKPVAKTAPPPRKAPPSKTAAKTAAKTSPPKKPEGSLDVTPADVARKAAATKPAATKPAATKAPAKKAPTKKAPATKAAAKKSTPSGKLPARKTAPKTAAEVVEDADLPSPIDAIGSSTGPAKG